MSSNSSDLSNILHEIQKLQENELDITLDESRTTSESTIDSLNFSTTSSPQIRDLNQSEFCQRINEKFGVSTSTLSEVLEIINILVSQNDQKNTNDPNANIDLLKGNNSHIKTKISDLSYKNCDLMEQNTHFQEQIDDLQFKNHKINDSLNFVENKLEEAQQTNQSLINQINLLTSSKKTLENTINSMSEIYENQISDTTLFVNQRNSLLQLLQKQNNALAYTERLISQMNLKKPCISQSSSNIQSQPNEGDEFQFHQAFLLFSQTISPLLPKYSKDISNIQHDSTKSIQDRIIQLSQYLCQKINESEEVQSSLNKNIQNFQLQIDKRKEQCFQILKLYQEQMRFLENMINSTNIQECVFYNPEKNDSVFLTSEAKDELLRRITKIGKFIQEQIPDIIESNDPKEIEKSFQHFEQIEPSQIFEIMNPASLKQKISLILSRIDTSSRDCQELLCMLSAQIFINEILQNHSNELKLHFDFIQKNKEQLFEENCNLHHSLECSEKAIIKLAKREEKIKKVLTDLFSIKSQGPINITSILKHLKENYHSIKANEIQELQKEIQKRNIALKKCESKIGKIQLCLRKKELENDKKIEKYECELTNLREEIRKIKNEKENTILQANSLREQLDKVSQQFSDSQKESDDKINDSKNQIIRIKSDFKAQIESLENENKLLSKKYSDQSIQVEYLVQQNQKQHDKIQIYEEMTQKSLTILKEKTQRLREQYENSLLEKDNEVEKIRCASKKSEFIVNSLTNEKEELKETLNATNFAKRVIELQLKAMEEKLVTQKQTLQAQYEASLHKQIIDSDQKLQNFEKYIQKSISSFAEKLNEKYRFNLNLISFSKVKQLDINIFLDSIENELQRRERAQKVFEETLGDISQIQSLLKLGDSLDLYRHVKQLYDENKQILNSQEDLSKQKDLLEQQINELHKKTLILEGEEADLNAWEMWGKRMSRVALPINCSSFSSDQLRRNLEEIVISSLNSESYLRKLWNLRQEKKFLLERKSEIEIKPNWNGSWHTIIALIGSIRRIKKSCGLLSFNSSNSEISPKLIKGKKDYEINSCMFKKPLYRHK